MKVAELLQILSNEGLEAFGRFYSQYCGYVEDANDPDFMGRLKVRVPEIHGGTAPEYWAHSQGIYAASQAGFYVLPKKGDAVWVSFEYGDPNKPLWTYGWFAAKEVPEAAKIVNNTNYVFQAGGHRLEFDEKEERVRITNSSGFVIELNKNGISIGKNTEGDEPAVLGDTLQKLLEDLITMLASATTMTLIGPQPLSIVSTLNTLKAQVKNIKSTKITLIK